MGAEIDAGELVLRPVGRDLAWVLLAHLLADPRVRRVAAETRAEHAASRRVLEKAGMRYCGDRTGEVDVKPARPIVYEAGPAAV
jgi:RimJ/RimL family protein N-acetyltransferase